MSRIDDGLTVDSQGGDTQDRLVNLDQFGGKITTLIREYDSSSNRKVAIEPRMPDTTTIGFNTYLKVPSPGFLGHRTNLQYYQTRHHE